MSRSRRCRALMIAAPASGQGKTTLTAALARRWREAGLAVRVFKTGPDFLDPMLLAAAGGGPVRQLDAWMGGEAHCRALLWQAAGEADVLLVEGVMGLHDGTPSSADLALIFGLPVRLVLDAGAMAQTFGALVLGLAGYRPGLSFDGVLANRVGSDGHAAMLRESLPPGHAWRGALRRDAAFELPSRHLGLLPPGEVDGIEARLSRLAAALPDEALALPDEIEFGAPAEEPAVGRPLAGLRIAVARDAAFAFLYAANLELLAAMGAALHCFSPLADEPVPDGCDALYLPGGYPELHLDALSDAGRCRTSIAALDARGAPIVAECGGMLALLQTLADGSGRRRPMWGLLPGDGALQPGLVNLGLQAVELPEGRLRGHSFHHAAMQSPLAPLTYTLPQRQHGRPEPVYRRGRLHASFLHLYFPSNPAATAALFLPTDAAAPAR